MFTAIGRFAAKHARGILVVGLLALIAAAVVGFTAFGKLKPAGFTDPGAESSKVQNVVDDEFGGDVDVVAMVRAKAGTVDDVTVRERAAALATKIAADPAVDDSVSYWQTRAPNLRSDDGTYGLIAIKLVHDDQDATKAFADAYADEYSGAYDLTFGGPKMLDVDSAAQIGKDLALAESVAVPIILILLVFAFGSFEIGRAHV